MRKAKYLNKPKETGITLIVLIIVIIILLILAGVSINAIVDDGGLLNSAVEAGETVNYSSELEAIKIAMTYAVGGETKKIGDALCSRTVENSERWYVVSDDDNDVIYGDGYYLLKKGTEYTIGTSTTYTLENDYVVNYDTQTVVLLNNYTEWNLTSTLATESTDNLILNIDPTLMGITTVWADELGKEEYYEISGISKAYNDYANEEKDHNGNYGYELIEIDSTGQETSGTGYIKFGDVVVNSENVSLDFNMDEVNNPEGVGGYITVVNESELDFSHGFTFEIYTTVSTKRGSGDIRYYSDGTTAFSLFSKMPTLTSTYGNAMRFGYATLYSGTNYTLGNNICKLYGSSSWSGEVSPSNGASITTSSQTKDSTATMKTKSGCVLVNECGYEDYFDDENGFVLTFVYTVYDNGNIKISEEEISEYEEWLDDNEYDDAASNFVNNFSSKYKEWLEYFEYEDSYKYRDWFYYNMRGNYSEGVDLIEYYINGELNGYTYYGHDSYEFGRDIWDSNEEGEYSPFFLGAAPWGTTGRVFYLQGSVFAARLYTCSLTKDEVIKDYNLLIDYRETFVGSSTSSESSKE